jgi:hypothetical protein
VVASDRLNWITVAYSHGTVRLPWTSRDELVARIKHLEAGAATIRAFEAAGASAPVRLDRADVLVVIDVIEEWMKEVGSDALPDGVFDLRNALHDDIHNDPDASR